MLSVDVGSGAEEKSFFETDMSRGYSSCLRRHLTTSAGARRSAAGAGAKYSTTRAGAMCSTTCLLQKCCVTPSPRQPGSRARASGPRLLMSFQNCILTQNRSVQRNGRSGVSFETHASLHGSSTRPRNIQCAASSVRSSTEIYMSSRLNKPCTAVLWGVRDTSCRVRLPVSCAVITSAT